MVKPATIRPVQGRAFEDILDGYFPLEESIRQMMARQRFAAVWITLLHAPVMDLPHLSPSDPVPLTLPKIYAGMIDFMAINAVESESGLRLQGLGEWFWVNPEGRSENFSVFTRLGEPAFVRGVGISSQDAVSRGPMASQAGVALAKLPAAPSIHADLAEATAELGWSSSRAWGLGEAGSAIRPMKGQAPSGAIFGESFDATPGAGRAGHAASSPLGDWNYVLVNTSADQVEPEALELARLL